MLRVVSVNKRKFLFFVMFLSISTQKQRKRREGGVSIGNWPSTTRTEGLYKNMKLMYIFKLKTITVRSIYFGWEYYLYGFRMDLMCTYLYEKRFDINFRIVSQYLGCSSISRSSGLKFLAIFDLSDRLVVDVNRDSVGPDVTGPQPNPV